MTLTKRQEKVLQRSLISVIKWSMRRSRHKLSHLELLENALKIVTAEISRNPIVIAKSLSVVNWAEARSKTAGVSTRALLESALRVAQMAAEDVKKETT